MRRTDEREMTAAERRRWSGFWEQLLIARMVAIVLLSVVIALLPVLGPDRLALAAFVGLGGTLVNFALLARVRAGQPVRALLATVDLVMVLGAIAFVPAVYGPATVLLVSMTASFVFWFGLRATPGVVVPVGTALLVIGLWRRPELWFPIWIAWLTTATIGTVAIGRMAAVSSETRQHYDDLVNGIDALVWEGSGPMGDVDYVSDRVTALFGFDAADFVRFSFLASHVHPDDLDTLIDSRRRLAEGEDVEVHYRVRDAWSRQRMIHERVRASLDGDGLVRHRRGVMVDETARWEAEDSVRRYVDFIEGIPIALAILRLDDLDDPRSLRVVVGNPASATLVGTTPEAAVDQLVADLLPDATLQLLDRLADVVRLDTSLERPYVDLGQDGEVYALRAMPLPDQCIGIALEDVTKRARLADSLRHQAQHDHLTGLPNRARLADRLGAALARASVDGHRTALLLMDLNQFKDVNDSLGHEFGDKLLVELARRLSRQLRNCDTIARLGGDEFAVLITEVSGEHAVIGVADRLVELCVEPFEIGEFRLQVGASVGVAVAPDNAADANALMRLADAAMYRAKEAGGGIVVHSDGQDADSVTKIDLLGELKEAVASDALVVHYQPRIDLTTLRPIGVEALVRWMHPQHGLLPPASFIELAEVSGTIQLLTRTVTERAATDMHLLAPATGFAVNVNLSSRNLHDPLLLDWVVDVLDRSGFAPDCLCFELTESQLIDDPGRSLEVLHGLRRLGVRLSIDDFGTGYSSMSFLRELPIDEVKIDRRFVADLAAGDATIARSVIDMGHNLGLHVVAEGVETAAALDALRELGCDSAQGFHLAVPMPLGDLARYLGGIDAMQVGDR